MTGAMLDGILLVLAGLAVAILAELVMSGTL